MTKAILGVLMLAGLSLVGCATAYGPLGFDGGYWDRRLASNIFQVGFSGNEFTGSADAYAFALRHAAEVTKAAGFKYFVMLNQNQATDNYQFQAPGSYNSYTNAYGYTTGTYIPGGTYDIQEPRTDFLIKCFKENPKGDSVDAYDILSATSTPPRPSLDTTPQLSAPHRSKNQ
ncbi:MAG TPA: hypothetical protein VK914_10180 [bacterium]|nr:hypothetical protein [bacterium]